MTIIIAPSLTNFSKSIELATIFVQKNTLSFPPRHPNGVSLDLQFERIAKDTPRRSYSRLPECAKQTVRNLRVHVITFVIRENKTRRFLAAFSSENNYSFARDSIF